MKIARTLIFCSLVASGGCLANELIDLGPKGNFEHADFVAIGRATATGIPFDSARPGRVAMSVEVEVVVKGDKRVRTILVPLISSAEFRCDYGVVGERYLLMLEKEPGSANVYVPYDFCYGVFRMQDTRRKYQKGV